MEYGALIGMLVALVGYAIPIGFFDTDEAVPNLRRDRQDPGMGWLGPALALGLGLTALIVFQVWIYESLRAMPRHASLVVFLGAAMVGAGIGNILSGYASVGTGSRWIAGKVYTFLDPARVRMVGAIRLLFGLSLLLWVLVSVT